MRLPAILLAAMCLITTVGASAQTPVNSASKVRFERIRRTGNALPALQRRVKIQFEDSDLEAALKRLMSVAGLPYTYNPELPGLRRRLSLNIDSVTVAEALLRVLRGSDIEPLISSAGEIVLRAGPTAAPDIRVRGIVLDRTSGEPVAAARVELVGSTLSALTDADGAFALSRHGPLRVTRFGFAPWNGEYEPSSSGATVRIELERAPVPLPQVVVVPGHFAALDSAQPAHSHLTRDQIENTPQIGNDLYRTLARIPGLVYTDFSAAFRVRGGVHDELYVSLDGLQLHEPFHVKDFGGGVSIVDGFSIGGVELTTGGFGARYGDRLTGVLNLRSVAPSARRTSLSFSLMGARAASQGVFNGDRGQWLLSMRRGYLDYAFKLTGAPRELEGRAFQQDRRFDPWAPKYHDLFAKARYAFSDRNVVSAHVLHANDALAFRNNEFHPLLHTDYGTNYLWLTWDHQASARMRATTILSTGHLSWLRQGERTDAANPEVEPFVRDSRNLSFVGLRQDWELGLSARAVMRWGLEYRHLNAEYDYHRFQQRAYVRDGTFFSELDSLDIGYEPTGNVFGAYLTQRVRVGPQLVAELGLRADRHDYTGDALLHPRFNLAYDVNPGTTVRGAWGRYSQAQGIHQLPVQDGVAAFDPAEIAEQRALSIEHRFRRGVQVRAELYERKTTRARPRYENALNETSGFPELENGRMRVPITSGVARGIEFLVERDAPGRTDAAASYVYALARDYVQGVSQPRAMDQRHSVNLDFSYRPAQHWRVNLDWRYHSGWPYTPVEIAAHRAGDRAGAEFRFGERNSGRLAAYHRLDARISREFPTRRGRVFVFLDAYNLYNRRNEGALGWWFIPNKDYAGRNGVVYVLDGSTTVRAGSRPHYLLPFLPSFGLNWEF
jgi:hypothetical protein